MTRLEEYGWRERPDPAIGRIVRAHGDYYHLVTDVADAPILARKKKSAFGRASSRTEEIVLPMTGDFVRFVHNPHGESMITELMPRFSHFERKDPTAHRQAQTLAVNFDTLLIMMSLNENFSQARLARYLDLAADIGRAQCVVVLTKSDLPRVAGLNAASLSAVGVPVVEISNVTQAGFAALSEYLQPRRTIALIGSSGVGKSSFVNALAGEERQQTQEIQSWSGKGRHTTTSRELIRLPNGVLVIDMPGIREIGRLGEAESLLVKGESTHRYRK